MKLIRAFGLAAYRQGIGIHVVLLALALVPSGRLTAQTFTVAPAAILGAAGPHARTSLGGFQIEGRATSGSYGGSFAYRWIRLMRTCKTSLPPKCDVDTPGGYMLLLRGSRFVVDGRVARLLAGVETGIARLRGNSGNGSGTHALLGARAEVEFPVDPLSFRLGAFFDWTHLVSFGGATLGIAVRL